METIDLSKLPNLNAVFIQMTNEIISKVPESVRPESVDIGIDLGSIVIKFNLDVRGNSIIFGSKGHWPPIDAIKAWVIKKNIQPRPDAKGKLPTIDQLSFLIARKISVEGTPPHDYYDSVTSDILSYYESRISEAFIKDLTDFIGLTELL